MGIKRWTAFETGVSCFFQAEDSIRDAQESRGLGDVYKRQALDWVALWALAVNEENASGGRVVTAPTHGAAGIIPAVLHYYCRFVPGTDDEGVVRFLLTACLLYTSDAADDLPCVHLGVRRIIKNKPYPSP